MLDFLFKLEISILAQVVIFVILITSYYLLQRKNLASRWKLYLSAS